MLPCIELPLYHSNAFYDLDGLLISKNDYGFKDENDINSLSYLIIFKYFRVKLYKVLKNIISRISTILNFNTTV